MELIHEYYFLLLFLHFDSVIIAALCTVTENTVGGLMDALCGEIWDNSVVRKTPMCKHPFCHIANTIALFLYFSKSI